MILSGSVGSRLGVNIPKHYIIYLPRGCKHTVFAKTELKIIEVQLGEEITVTDKQKFETEI